MKFELRTIKEVSRILLKKANPSHLLIFKVVRDEFCVTSKKLFNLLALSFLIYKIELD